MTARMLLLCIGLIFCNHLFAMNAEVAHRIIEQEKPELLGDGDQVVSFYYFGQSDETTIVGLEKIGSDYLPIRWLLVFQEEELLGWYYPSQKFPLKIVEGQLKFPKGTKVEDAYLLPEPAQSMVIDDVVIPFYPLSNSD